MNSLKCAFCLGLLGAFLFTSHTVAQSDQQRYQRKHRYPPQEHRSMPRRGTGAAANISARVGDFSRELPDDLLCYNVNTLMAEDWSDPRLVSKVVGLDPDVLRIPGGTVANYWDWQRGGLVDLKGLTDTPGQFRPEHVLAYDSGKLEGYRGLFVETGARAMIVLNMLTSDLDSQIAYIRQALDAGLPVRYVELGNELYESRASYTDVYPTPESYAEAAATWARAVRQAFPDLKVAVIGANPRVAARKADQRVSSWNDVGLEKALPDADALTFHDYQPATVRSREFPPEEVDRALAFAGQQTRQMVSADLTSRMPASSEIWVTEFNILPQKGSPAVAGTWMHALYAVTMAATFLEQSSVTITCNHVLVGNADFAAIFADEDVMQAPVFNSPDQRSAASVQPFTLSAPGLALALYAKSVQDKQKATLLEFTPPAGGAATDSRYGGQRMPAGDAARDPRSSGQRMPAAGQSRDPRGGDQRMTGNRSPVYGWLYEGSQGQWSAFVLNLSARNITLQAEFLTRFGYEQLSAAPDLVVSRDGQLMPVTGDGQNTVSLPAYSITRLYSR